MSQDRQDNTPEVNPDSTEEVINQTEEAANEQTEEAEAAAETAAEAAEGAAESEALKKAEEELAAANDRYLRMCAEYDNYRKRTAKEKADTYNSAVSSTVESFLTVIDNFERALAAPTADEAFKNGMVMIFNQYKGILEKLGVEELDVMGKPFDPNFANAVNQVEDENFGENTVCMVLQKGYRLGGKVIRHAMVTVANP